MGHGRKLNNETTWDCAYGNLHGDLSDLDADTGARSMGRLRWEARMTETAVATDEPNRDDLEQKLKAAVEALAEYRKTARKYGGRGADGHARGVQRTIGHFVKLRLKQSHD